MDQMDYGAVLPPSLMVFLLSRLVKMSQHITIIVSVTVICWFTQNISWTIHVAVNPLLNFSQALPLSISHLPAESSFQTIQSLQ